MSEIPEELWRYEEDLRRFARYLCRNPHVSDDIAHTALVKAAEHSDDFRGEASMRTWLHTIVSNECKMMRRRKTPISLDRYLEARTPVGQPPAELPTDIPDPSLLAEESELRRLALDTLRTMPGHYRTALFMQVALRRSVEDIAESLGKSVPATRAILYRARSAMRGGVAEYLDRDPIGN